MQLIFTKEELKVLADTLLDREREAIARGDKRDPVLSLVQKVVERDLRFGIDELEDLEEAAKRSVETLKTQIAECVDVAQAEVLRQRQLLLERIVDRVTEACAMA